MICININVVNILELLVVRKNSLNSSFFFGGILFTKLEIIHKIIMKRRKGGIPMSGCGYGSSAAIVLVLFILLIIILGAWI